MLIVYSHMVKLKFLPATATKGSRYKATWNNCNRHDEKVSVTWNREYDLDHIDYLHKAVNAFLAALESTVLPARKQSPAHD